MRKIRLSIITLLLIFSGNAFSAGYDIKRSDDGPFSFSISGIKLNEGSTLKRESILFNDKTCPVKILSHSTSILYKDRGFRFSGKTKINVKKKIKAINIRTILFDIFGQHISNLSNTEAKDFSVGEASVNGAWRASENDIIELLTSVTYVSRVRYEDGTQWISNKDNLQLALSSLHLEKKIGEDDENE